MKMVEMFLRSFEGERVRIQMMSVIEKRKFVGVLSGLSKRGMVKDVDSNFIVE